MKMSALKVTVQVFLLVCLFSGLDALLSCPCSGGTCDAGGEITCANDDEICFAAIIRKNDGSLETEKGCKEKDKCVSDIYCPVRAFDDKCAKYGCCNYNSCVVNYTMGEDFKKHLVVTSSLAVESSTPAVEPSTPAVEPSTPAVEPSSPAVEPSSPAVASPVAPMMTKPEMSTTSSFRAKMTTEPVMPTAKMSEVKLMTSSQAEVKATGSKKELVSSEKMEPSQSNSNGVFKSETLRSAKPRDDRPTCGAGQVFSAVFVMIIGLFCSIF